MPSSDCMILCHFWFYFPHNFLWLGGGLFPDTRVNNQGIQTHIWLCKYKPPKNEGLLDFGHLISELFIFVKLLHWPKGLWDISWKADIYVAVLKKPWMLCAQVLIFGKTYSLSEFLYWDSWRARWQRIYSMTDCQAAPDFMICDFRSVLTVTIYDHINKGG